MASKMRTMHTIPADFPQILKDFTREILRNQPQNIYQFGKEYFAARIREESPNESINNEYLVQYLTDLFIQADTNQNGRLDKKEFKELMFRADLGLSKDDIKLIFMEADVDDSGSLEYEEFIPLMMHVIESIKEVEHAKEEENFVREQAEEIAEEYMLRGITSQELEKYLRASFMEADRDSSGQLDAKEFKTFLMNCPINLTKKEINAIYMEVDTDQNGLISLEEFIPVFHSLMFQLTTNEALRLIRQQDLQELPQILIGCCSKYDPEGTGLLHPKQIAKAIRDADLGLSRFQIFQLVGQCNREEDGVKYVPFIEGVAAPLIAKLVDIDLELAYKRAVRVEEQVDYAGKQAEELLGMPQEVFEKVT
uniref:EF-hand domain-containing protein n=1 Tax=Hanusia phi TaxID=3032 RepID=A0A7S0EGD2_9CRYP|mmetsp:Transcript_2404/g.5710  ORF Transcript_2404/g.5710 Transcript_2404/m.5710 type:complete len:366 (+) Transcript_2404:25-1122(+)